MKNSLLIRFSSKMLFGDSILRSAAAASFVSMLSSAPETVVSVTRQKIHLSDIHVGNYVVCIVVFMALWILLNG